MKSVEYFDIFAPLAECETAAFCPPLDDGSLAALQSAEGDAFVLRTSPCEAMCCTDPIDGAALFAYNTAFAARSAALREIGGIDKKMGCAAATDAVLRLAAVGKKTVYLPECTASAEQSPRPDYGERLFGVLKLRARFGSLGDVGEGIVLALKCLLHPRDYGVERSHWFGLFFKNFGALFALLCQRAGRGRQYKNTVREWFGADFGFFRGEHCAVEDTVERPLVSIITRTCKRPETLRKTLESLRRQTYKRLEIVVIEDGEPLAREMIKKDFADLPIVYRATGENIGRAAAANLGFSVASGEFLNLLDDDDYLFPEYAELAVKRALEKRADVVFTRGVAYRIDKLSESPYEFAVRGRSLLDFPRVDEFTMVRRCVTTQNGVLFSRSLCERVGGMRTELGAHEDWNLFLRLMTAGSFTTLDYASCVYIVPADENAERERLARYSKFDSELLRDEKLVFALSDEKLESWYDSVIRDLMYLHTLGQDIGYLRSESERAARFLEGRERPMSFARVRTDKPPSLTGEQLKELYCTLICELKAKADAGEYDALLHSEHERIIKK